MEAAMSTNYQNSDEFRREDQRICRQLDQIEKTRNYHREITEERDRLRSENEFLLKELREIARIARGDRRLGSNLNAVERIARDAIAKVEEGKS
jgi:hypothetical protein